MQEEKKKEIIKNGEKNISKDIRKIERRIPVKEKSKIVPTLQNLGANISSLYEMAVKDEKTGLYNTRFFNTILEMEIEKSVSYNKDLSIIMVDADNFKRVNDMHGHKKGDDVLKIMAKTLSKNLRKGDIIARYGGEEFIILLPNANLRKALKISERLRKKIMDENELSELDVTISAGISHFKPGDNIASLFDKADKALLVAKKEGKNKSILLGEMDIHDINRLSTMKIKSEKKR